MQLADEGRSDAVRRDRRLRDRRSGPTRQSGSTGLGVQCKSTRRGMRWVFIILTSRSFFLGKPSPFGLGVKSFKSRSMGIFSCNDTSGEDRYRFRIRVINRAASFARESDLYPQSRVVYRVVRLREDSLQLPRPNPAVQQQARSLRVTTECIHIYVFKQIIACICYDSSLLR